MHQAMSDFIFKHISHTLDLCLREPEVIGKWKDGSDGWLGFRVLSCPLQFSSYFKNGKQTQLKTQTNAEKNKQPTQISLSPRLPVKTWITTALRKPQSFLFMCFNISTFYGFYNILPLTLHCNTGVPNC